MNSTSVYAVKVWLTSVLASPVLLWVIYLLINLTSGDWHKPGTDVFGVYLLFVMAGGILSVPSLILLLLITHWVIRAEEQTSRQKRVTLSALGALLAAMPLMLIFMYFNTSLQEYGVIIITYVLTIVAGIWFYKFDEPVPA